MKRLGAFIFRYRNGLFPLMFVGALAAGAPMRSPVLDVAGVLIALLGQALRILTIGYEYIERGGRARKVYASTLVQGGVFAHCRNPLYLGNLLIALGLALLINSPAFYLLFLPFMVLVYMAIVAAEEEFLAAKFGPAYAAYCVRVRRWWPRWRGFSASRAGMHFHWGRVLVKEYNTTFLLLAALIGLHLWTEYALEGKGALPAAKPAAAAIGLWVLLYLGVRGLKKSGLVRGEP